jgi:CheY-like chemotaxis protein
MYQERILICMPIMDGFEVLNELTKIKQTNLILVKVVVLTASSHPDDIEKIKILGIKDYLEKPVTEDKILLLMA